MNLNDHYDLMFEEAVDKIETDQYSIDKMLDSTTDRRFGLSLVLRPGSEIRKNIQSFLDAMSEADPGQYYYPDSDMHVTVMSLVSCFEGFSMEDIVAGDYIEIVNQSMAGIENISIEFRGITASDEAIMIRGFPLEFSLEKLRDNLRDHFKDSGLLHTIDKRYPVFMAHSTVVRYIKKIKDKPKLLEVMKKFRDHYFGTFKATKLDLVYNDWYLRSAFVKPLHSFSLET